MLMIELFLTARFESCVPGASYFFFAGHARETRKGERRPPLLFSPRAVSKKKTLQARGGGGGGDRHCNYKG